MVRIPFSFAQLREGVVFDEGLYGNYAVLIFKDGEFKVIETDGPKVREYRVADLQPDLQWFIDAAAKKMKK